MRHIATHPMKPYTFNDVKSWARTLPPHREPRTNRTVFNELVKAEHTDSFVPGIRGKSMPDVLKHSFSFADTPAGTEYWEAVIETMERETAIPVPLAC